MPVQIIQTCGYEGLSIGKFVDRLVLENTKTVIDVRANPLSRKPGFSKKAFGTNLAAADIEYIHAPKLGCPKNVRDRYRADGDWARYSRGFLSYLAGQSEAVAEVASVAMKGTTCLVCFEADFNFCHRTFVARAAAALMKARIVHLRDRAPVVESWKAAAA
jgi:uncharacterized protein (DUF488 family)